MLPLSQPTDRRGGQRKGKRGAGGRRYTGPYTGHRGECTRSNQSFFGSGQCKCIATLPHNTLPFPKNQIVLAQIQLLPSERQKNVFCGISLVHFSITVKNNEDFKKKIKIGNRATRNGDLDLTLKSVKGGQRFLKGLWTSHYFVVVLSNRRGSTW